MALHLLARQLRRPRHRPAGPSPAAPWAALLERVSCAYTDADQERYLLERSQTLASGEMTRLNEALQAERDQLESRVRERTEALRLGEGRLANLVRRRPTGSGSRMPVAVHLHLRGASREPPASIRSSSSASAAAQSNHFEARDRARPPPGADPSATSPFRTSAMAAAGPTGCCATSASAASRSSTPTSASRAIAGSAPTRQATLAAQQVRQLASYDSLSGLPNRNLFVAGLERALAQRRGALAATSACASSTSTASGRFNDTLGHAAGDQLLPIMGARLRELLRGTT
ncbi:MAG: GGDEF domain-containing protein [Ideonella sp.]|nr:GGDEF domain-containing protein [Ideonella sp.]